MKTVELVSFSTLAAPLGAVVFQNKVEMKGQIHDAVHTLKVLMLDAATGFYRMQRYRVGDFFGPVDLGIYLF